MTRPREQHGAGGQVVHLLRWFDKRPACGVSPEHIVGTYAKVTCSACKRTVAWKERGLRPGERRTHANP